MSTVAPEPSFEALFLKQLKIEATRVTTSVTKPQPQRYFADPQSSRGIWIAEAS